MIRFLSIYPDELFYSYIMRNYAHSGYMFFSKFKNLLFDKKTLYISVEYANRIKDDVCDKVFEIISPRKILLEHTMFSYYSTFISYEDKKLAIDSIEKKGEYLKPHIYTRKKIPRQTLKYCPLCVSDDRKKYGETYWHRLHQVDGIEVCPIHLCRLFKSDISLQSNAPKILSPADCIIPTILPVEHSNNIIEKEFVMYYFDVISNNCDIVRSVSIGDYLASKLTETKYTSSRGGRRHLQNLFDDIRDHYHKLNLHDYLLMENIKNIELIFQNRNLNTIEICLIAKFLGITPLELLNPVLPKDKQSDIFDKKVLEMYNKGIAPLEISKELKFSYSNILLICAGKYRANK